MVKISESFVIRGWFECGSKEAGPAAMWDEIKEATAGEKHTWKADLVCLRHQACTSLSGH